MSIPTVPRVCTLGWYAHAPLGLGDAGNRRAVNILHHPNEIMKIKAGECGQKKGKQTGHMILSALKFSCPHSSASSLHFYVQSHRGLRIDQLCRTRGLLGIFDYRS